MGSTSTLASMLKRHNKPRRSYAAFSGVSLARRAGHPCRRSGSGGAPSLSLCRLLQLAGDELNHRWRHASSAGNLSDNIEPPPNKAAPVKGEEAPVPGQEAQRPFPRALSGLILDDLHTLGDHVDHGQVAEVVGAGKRQTVEHLHVLADSPIS